MTFSELTNKKSSDLIKDLEKKREQLRVLRSSLSASSRDVKATRNTKQAIAQILTALSVVTEKESK